VTVRNNGDEMINKKRKKKKEETDNSHSVDFQSSSSIRPLRQSNRLKKIEPIESSNYNNDDYNDYEKNSNVTTNNSIINYDKLPYESDELDDYEFQIFIYLRKWRLNRSKELNIESYKIFQNRTICECIRRKRNDINWGNIDNYHDDDVDYHDNDHHESSNHYNDRNDHHHDIDHNVSLCYEKQHDIDSINNECKVDEEKLHVSYNLSTMKTTTTRNNSDEMITIKKSSSSSLLSLKDINIYNITTIYKDYRCYDNKVRCDLLLCWGIGPVKVQDNGFAWELIYLLSFDATILMNLNHSRAFSSSITILSTSDVTTTTTTTTTTTSSAVAVAVVTA